MELSIEIRLSDIMADAREELLKSLEIDLRKVDPEASVSALNPYTLVDPNLLHIIVQTIGGLDPGSAVAGAAGAGIAPRVLRRAITRLAAFAKKFAQPLPVKVGDISFELPPDTPAAEVGKIVTQIVAKLRQQLPVPPNPLSGDGKSRRKVKTSC
jgi:hypothetical protein